MKNKRCLQPDLTEPSENFNFDPIHSASVIKEKYDKTPFFGNTNVKIWQPSSPCSFLNDSNGFLVPKNMCIESKIGFLGQLEGKLRPN